ncbi:hypothetical protein FNV43_RR17736 [Rhamnella rubrinervis]|uniref:Late embryogenesis abundant protein LEA-2 subgroup domain-containing protein n=1 Tax=Rhamnella rubrinervis TaxID=2594499 RepID=A0A8K0E3R6_9ROSA|nr:hypothetical protein FNV43_RR17736 [Rhamnella rubrinervis]
MTPVGVDGHPPYSNAFSYPPQTFYTTTTASGFRPSQPTNSQTPHLAIRRLILLVVVLLVLVCASIAIAWLSLNPRLPLITLNSFTISNFTLFKSQLVSNSDIELTVRNPNKKVTLRLESFNVVVWYREKVPLSRTWMEDLHLEKKTETVSKAKLGFEGRDEISGCKKVLGDSGWNLRNGSVILNVEMSISAKFRAGDWLTMRKSISVSCNKVELVPAYNGTGKLHEHRQCLVGVSV